jgi:2-methylisocitrate lyase-like PEP mutase family enzyme
MGFSVILYANAAMQGAILGSQTVLRSLRGTGSLDTARDQLAPWDERQRLVRKATYDELEHRYAPNDSRPAGSITRL